MMSRPPVERISIFALLSLLGFFTADLGLLYLRASMYPSQPPPASPSPRPMSLAANENYGSLLDRNIFNSDGKIPPALGEKADGSDKEKEVDPEPVESKLGIVLLGTIVHADPARSIATVGVKAKNDVFSVRPGDVIPENLATLIQVERSKITFRNKATNHREYIELKDDSKVSFGSARAKPVQQGEVLKVSDTDFEVKRDDINRLTNNLPELLQKARAVPRIGAGGVIECFSLADIATGSIYERLGLKKGDCLKSVNGEKIDSPAKAMELYNALRSSANTINLGIERNGTDSDFQYNITN